MAVTLYIGMGPRYVVRARVKAGPDFDPVAIAAAVAAITLLVTKPSGEEVAWDAEILASSEASLTLQHRFAVEDLDERGRYAVSARFLMNDGEVVRTKVGRLGPVLATNQQSA